VGRIVPFRRDGARRPNRRKPAPRPAGRRIDRAVLVVTGLLAVALIAWDRLGETTPEGGGGSAIRCTSLRVIDGDTLDCAGLRIRLAGIDAPELKGHCPPGRVCVAGDPIAARARLQSLAGPGVRCRPGGQDRYGRTIARCQAQGRDLSCAMLRSGHAERRYGPIACLPRLAGR